MKTLLSLFVTLLMFGCAVSPVPAIDVTTTKLAIATHDDLMAAAKYADDHGYPARAAVWRARDALLTAREQQINACAAAIRAALPKPAVDVKLTPFLAIEMTEEAAGNFSGIPASVKLSCADMPLVGLPALPRP